MYENQRTHRRVRPQHYMSHIQAGKTDLGVLGIETELSH